MNFTHYISTRFNVPTKIWGNTRDGHKPLTEEWLSDRFELFMNYCLPSFKIQTNQNFEWLVFFDKDTPEKYVDVINKIAAEYKNFKPLFVADYEDMFKNFQQKVKADFNEYIITTDIDNDDMLHKDFVKTIQSLFQPTHDLVIDMKLGLQLTKLSEKTAILQYLYYTGSPFVSLVEKRDEAKTVMHQSHTLYRENENFVSYDSQPRYIQYIHENNLVNSTSPNMKRLGTIDYDAYGISKNAQLHISKSDAFFFNLKRNFNILSKLLKKRN